MINFEDGLLHVVINVTFNSLCSGPCTGTSLISWEISFTSSEENSDLESSKLNRSGFQLYYSKRRGTPLLSVCDCKGPHTHYTVAKPAGPADYLICMRTSQLPHRWRGGPGKLHFPILFIFYNVKLPPKVSGTSFLSSIHWEHRKLSRASMCIGGWEEYLLADRYPWCMGSLRPFFVVFGVVILSKYYCTSVLFIKLSISFFYISWWQEA